MDLYKYNDFLFENIILDIFLINEAKDEEPVTFEWDLRKEKSKNKLKDFLSKLPKERVFNYLLKFIDKMSLLPEKTRRKTLLIYSGLFIAILSTGYIENNVSTADNSEIIEEFIELSRTSSFDISQEMVSFAEGGYSNDRKDTGNFVDFKMGDKKVKRFIGSKYGISAPILKRYLGRLPTKEDMINLKYETALEIYKKRYWDRQSINKYCNQSIANIIYDGCVNQGINGMRDVLRKVLRENGVQITDTINPFEEEFIKNINILNQEKVFKDIKKHREERYKEARTFKAHGEGWLKRLSRIEFE